MSSVRKIWDCYPWELGEPYATFTAWLHAGPTRPTADAWAHMHGDARIAHWAVQGLWAQRAALYDREVATREIVVKLPLFAGIAPRLLALIESRIRDLEAATAAGQFEAISTRDMIALTRLLLAMQRETRHLAQAPNGALEDSAVDYSSLSVEELRTFQELLAKASRSSDLQRAETNNPRIDSCFT